MNSKVPSIIRYGRSILLIAAFAFTQSCYHYRVLTTKSDPVTEYEKTTMWSYCWGLINSPQNFVVPNCTQNNALDEVQFSTKFTYSLLTIVTLGIVSPVEVKWKCHKPPQRVGGM